VLFLPSQPNSEIPKFLSMADVCLVHLRKNKLYEITIPCKSYEYMAMGKPIIMGVKGEAKDLVDNAMCGISVEPENAEDLSLAVLNIYNDKAKAKSMGENAAKYALKYFSKDKVAGKYVDFIERIAKASS